MPRTGSYDRLRRLELIAVQLKQDVLCTVADLAEQHGVSERTITRDLQLMRDQGLPIDADRGRGGGVRIDRNWGVGRLNLSYPEAVDLLVSISVAEQMNSPLFLANLGSIRRQLVASFAPEKRRRIEELNSRIAVGTTASTAVQRTFEKPAARITQRLHQCFLNQNALIIRYTDEAGQTTNREIEPHYLLLNYPVWYVLAFDRMREAPRTFRCDRITEAEDTGSRFQLLSKTDFDGVFDGNGLEKLKTALG